MGCLACGRGALLSSLSWGLGPSLPPPGRSAGPAFRHQPSRSGSRLQLVLHLAGAWVLPAGAAALLSTAHAVLKRRLHGAQVAGGS